jgi:hypothetical protein
MKINGFREFKGVFISIRALKILEDFVNFTQIYLLLAFHFINRHLLLFFLPERAIWIVENIKSEANDLQKHMFVFWNKVSFFFIINHADINDVEHEIFVILHLAEFFLEFLRDLIVRGKEQGESLGLGGRFDRGSQAILE